MGWLEMLTGWMSAPMVPSESPTDVRVSLTTPPDVVTAMVLKPLNDRVPGTKKVMLV